MHCVNTPLGTLRVPLGWELARSGGGETELDGGEQGSVAVSRNATGYEVYQYDGAAHWRTRHPDTWIGVQACVDDVTGRDGLL